eukprot:s12090_g1.t1
MQVHLSKSCLGEPTPVSKVVPTTGQSIQCNLCSLMDCFKLARPQPTVTEESTEVTFHASSGSQGDVVHADTARRRRPVRPRFPGVAVDPASAGCLESRSGWSCCAAPRRTFWEFAD